MNDKDLKSVEEVEEEATSDYSHNHCHPNIGLTDKTEEAYKWKWLSGKVYK